ncbi:MAG: WG repeat-containing protein [Bacteroidia bacterium]
MIELDYLSAYHDNVNSLEQSHPRALPWSAVLGTPPENVYIFRNEAGVRVKQYGKITGKVKLLSVKKSEKVATHHNHFSSRIGASYGFSQIRTRLFPYYLIREKNHDKNKFGLIDSLGNVVLAQKYDEIISDFNGFIFIAQKGKTYELRDRDLSLKYSTSKYVLQIAEDQNFVRFYKGNVCGLKDKEGKTMIPAKYTIIWPFNQHGLAKVRNEQHLEGFVDQKGKEVIECKYQNFGKFTEGLIGARLNYKRGFIDTEGKTVIPFIYDHAFWFAEGLTRVSKKINGTYYFGYIDKQGNEVIPLKYANATDFKDGIAEVRIDFPDEHTRARPAVTSEDFKKGTVPKREGVWIKIDKTGVEVK